MPAVRLEGVANAVLGPLDLHVADGEAVAVLGPSGAGKSTLLKIIAGLLPHEGRVFFDDRDMTRVPAHRRSLGYMSQDPLLFPHLSVALNLSLALLFDPTASGKRRERISTTLRQCAITHRAHRRPTTLSGGERQRASLARALVRRPRLLLLDEPFANLDAATRALLWEELESLRQKEGLTLILVTHDETEASRLCSRHLRLKDGYF